MGTEADYAALAGEQAQRTIGGRNIDQAMNTTLAELAQESAAWRPAHVGLVDGVPQQVQMQTRANTPAENAWGSVTPGTTLCPPLWNQAVVTGSPGQDLPD